MLNNGCMNSCPVHGKIRSSQNLNSADKNIYRYKSQAKEYKIHVSNTAHKKNVSNGFPARGPGSSAPHAQKLKAKLLQREIQIPNQESLQTINSRIKASAIKTPTNNAKVAFHNDPDVNFHFKGEIHSSFMKNNPRNDLPQTN